MSTPPPPQGQPWPPPAQQGQSWPPRPQPPKKRGLGRGVKVTVWVVGILIGLGVIAQLGGGSTDSATSPASGTSSNAAPAAAAPVATTSAAPAKPVAPPQGEQALAKAESYATRMNMSKRGVYDQLTSQYGEKFPPAAAQYAVDNVKADWNANALAKAKSYRDRMNMSTSAIRDQLTSEYGEKFTAAEAAYAIANLG